MKKCKITGVGSCIPNKLVENNDFLSTKFLNEDGTDFNIENSEIISKFKKITGIEQRRYAEPKQTAFDLAHIAAENAIKNAGINRETLDYIIVAHNFGSVSYKDHQTDTIPALAARVKNLLQIENPNCVAYDLIFGCPGWIEGVIQAQAFIRTGMAERVLVIGAETLSRVVDKHDRDSMIFSDGAGATIIEASTDDSGILSFASQTYSKDEVGYLNFGKSYKKDANEDTKYIKMQGRKIYEFALTKVPNAMRIALEKSNLSINDVSKIFIHQANEKMDEAIVKRFYRLFKLTPPEHIMPMSIKYLGNSSVATVPTLYDMVLRNKIEDQSISKDDVIIFASVGAGMNINAIVYRV